MKNMCIDELCRPGGFKITERAINYCGFPQKAKLADVGCGLGATVAYLRNNYDFDIWGIEKDKGAVEIAQSEFVLLGDAAQLPFDDLEMDGLLFECSLSRMEHPKKVLAECCRVLKPEGYLIISDLYARGKRAALSGMLGRIETKEALLSDLKNNGFITECFEDYTDALQTMWGQLIFQSGIKALCDNFGTDCQKLRQIKCGYCLIIVRRRVSL